MTRAGILTKYSLGYVLPGKAGFSWRAGKILQMVSEAWDAVGEIRGNVRVDGKRIEGAREKKIGALGSPDRNTWEPKNWLPYMWNARSHTLDYRAD